MHCMVSIIVFGQSRVLVVNADYEATDTLVAVVSGVWLYYSPLMAISMPC